MGLLTKLVRKKTGQAPRDHRTQPVSLYRGVQIVAGDKDCCRTVKILASQRFLTDEIPKLPLEQCDATECRCSYKLFDDRRTDERRLSDFGYDIISEMRTDDDQRSSDRDRRGNYEGVTALLTRIASGFR